MYVDSPERWNEKKIKRIDTDKQTGREHKANPKTVIPTAVINALFRCHNNANKYKKV